MKEAASNWPSYHSAPRDATFALGVISAGYSRLEFSFGAVFTNVIGIPSTFASILLPKLSNEVSITLIEESMAAMNYSTEVQNGINQFIVAYRSLVFNRNMLMHSQIMAGGATTSVLLKTQKNGQMVGCPVTLDRLRQIADDMEVYRQYGINLANHIGLPRIARVFGIDTPIPEELTQLPDQPALPVRLTYTSEPIPVK
jgi:hypothetical protein